MTMERPGHLLVTLCPGEALEHVPAHVDCLLGAGRPASRLDGGLLDQALREGGGFRAIGVYHARESLGRIGEQQARFDDREERLGLSRTYAIQLGDTEATQRVVEALRSSPKVESAVVQTLASAPFGAATAVALDEPRVDDAWAPHERVASREAHELEPGSVDVTVGIVDTGVSLGHPEFQRKLLAGYDTVRLGLGRVASSIKLVDDSVGADFCPRDAVGHGSHVAGVIGAQGWHLPPGIAGRALILPIRVLAAAFTGEGGEPVGIGALPDIDAGVKVACDLGATVLNLSFGTASSAVTDGPRPHEQVIQYATELGCTLIAATGNSGALETFYPACLPDVIAVGSVDTVGRRSRFSTYGDHVSLCAPGEHIVSSARRGYKSGSGTSYAAPFVAGAAALLVSRARRKGKNLSGARVRALLQGSATPLGDGYSIETGHGLLNAAAALRLLDREESSEGGAR